MAVVCVVALAGGTVAWQLGGARGAPGDTLATVNGQEITRGEFDLQVDVFKSQFEAQGQEIEPEMLSQIHQQVFQTLITVEVVVQEAEKQDIQVSEEEIDEELAELAEFSGGKEQLEAQLAERGLTIDDHRKWIRNNLLIEYFVEDYLEGELSDEDLEVTADELEARYDQYKEMTEDPEPLEDIREQLELQIQEERRNQAVQGKIQALMEEADIEILQPVN